MNKFNYSIILFAVSFMHIGYAMEEEEGMAIFGENQARIAREIQEQRAQGLRQWLEQETREGRKKLEKEEFGKAMQAWVEQQKEDRLIYEIEQYYGKSPQDMTPQELRSNFAQAPVWMKRTLWDYIKGAGLVYTVIPEAEETHIEFR